MSRRRGSYRLPTMSVLMLNADDPRIRKMAEQAVKERVVRDRERWEAVNERNFANRMKEDPNFAAKHCENPLVEKLQARGWL